MFGLQNSCTYICAMQQYCSKRFFKNKKKHGKVKVEFTTLAKSTTSFSLC